MIYLLQELWYDTHRDLGVFSKLEDAERIRDLYKQIGCNADISYIKIDELVNASVKTIREFRFNNNSGFLTYIRSEIDVAEDYFSSHEYNDLITIRSSLCAKETFNRIKEVIPDFSKKTRFRNSVSHDKLTTVGEGFAKLFKKKRKKK